MLLLDVSNICYTGSTAKTQLFGPYNEFKIRSIVYFLEKVACYYSTDKDMIAVFENVGKMPQLAGPSGYKSGRARNPHVEWELICLKQMLELVGFPILSVDRVEADHVIKNYCEQNRNRENIFIISADQDLASNVREDEFATQILSYSSVSYNINKNNFKEITGVHYNFMDLYKLLCGCKSDKIKPVPRGRDLYNVYIANLESIWKRRYKYDKTEHSMSALVDWLIEENNTLEAFLAWYRNSSYYRQDTENELLLRKELIVGPTIPLPRVGKVNWEAYNGLVQTLNLENSCGAKSDKSLGRSESLYNAIVDIMAKGQTSTRTMFEADFNSDASEAEIIGIENIRQLMEGEGGVL